MCRENWWRRQANSVALILLSSDGTVAELAQICQAWGARNRYVAHDVDAPLAGERSRARPWALNPRHLMPSVRDVARGSGYAAVLEAYESSPDLRAAAARKLMSAGPSSTAFTAIWAPTPLLSSATLRSGSDSWTGSRRAWEIPRGIWHPPLTPLRGYRVGGTQCRSN